MPEPDGEAVGDGGRRVGDLLPGGGEPAAHRRVQEKVPLHTQDTARSGMDVNSRNQGVTSARDFEKKMNKCKVVL